MKRIDVSSSVLAALLLLAMTCHAHAQAVVNIWPGVAPGSEHWTQQEVVARDTPVGTVAINVVTPTLTAYLPAPDTATGTGIIIAPGGYCLALALDQGGTDVARWLQQRGIAAFVLKYRTQEKREDGIPRGLDMDKACHYGIADAIQAVKLVRRDAATWGIAPGRIGMMGFSAGGMVASGALLQADVAARPDFVALLYGAPFGTMPAIPVQLPPVFMAWAQDDEVGRNAMVDFHAALLKAGTTPDTHVYASGGHGFAIKTQGKASDRWTDDLLDWLERTGMLSARTPAGASARAAAPPPDFTPRNGFDGASEGDGVLTLLLGKPRPFHVESRGSAQADGTFRLQQTVTFQGKPPQDRVWVLTTVGPDRYTATLSDAAGPVTGTTTGPRLSLHYRVRGPLVMHQELTLLPDGKTIDNIGVITLLGIPVGHLHETITRKGSQSYTNP